MLITFYERHNVVMRAAALGRINSGERYREIAEALWISPQTVSSLKKALHERSYKSYRERGKSERKKRIYSRDLARKEKKSRGRPVRTKYGTLYLP